jgi:formate/nitrite transporter FocA (FNT family)
MSDNAEKNSKAQAGPRSPEIHSVIRQEGEQDLARHRGAVAWSGLAAGLSMGFSFLTMAIIQSQLPAQPWQHLVSSFGYTLGFLIVVLGRQQLFTESTLTAVLPVLSDLKWPMLGKLLVFWHVVLLTNLLGTLLFALLICHEGLFPQETWQALGELADGALKDGFWPTLIKAVLAGWLIALMVWLLPGSGPARPLIIIILTYVVAVSRFSHVIAGSAEAAFALLLGHATAMDYAWRFLAPTLIGNTIGGVALVALLNHAPLATEA